MTDSERTDRHKHTPPGLYRLSLWSGARVDAVVGQSDDGKRSWFKPVTRVSAHDVGSVIWDWTMVRDVEALVPIPMRVYINTSDADVTIPVIADMLAAGKYSEAIAAYLETHWPEVKRIYESTGQAPRHDKTPVKVESNIATTDRELVFTCGSLRIVAKTGFLNPDDMRILTTHTPNVSYQIERGDVEDFYTLVGFVCGWMHEAKKRGNASAP